MAKGTYMKWVKPDRRQKQTKPQVSVASYVVDQWRRMAYAGIAFGCVGMAGALAAGAYAFAKESLPDVVLAGIVEGGRLVETYVDDGTEPLDDRVACAVLRETVVKLRAVSGPAAAVKAQLEVAANNFADRAAVRARRELDAQGWYAPLIAQRRTREVLPEIVCYRLAGAADTYNLEWTERIHTQSHQVEGETRRTLSVVALRVAAVPASVAKWNPWGLMVTEYSGVLD